MKAHLKLLNFFRSMPDFIIIGCQKSGTTSLYNYLISHPDIMPSTNKEIHFFDNNYSKGVNWYRSHFPVVRSGKMTGEASPYYIFHPHAAERLYQTLPDVKLIIMFRNPVYRAYSHYNHNLKMKRENLSFSDAIGKESERLSLDFDKLMSEKSYNSYNHQHYSYISRGIYIDQLQAWEKYFPRDQVHIIKSEEFYGNSRSIFNGVIKFLGLQEYEFNISKIYNQGRYANDIDKETRDRLHEFYAPYNEKLYRHVDRDFHWNINDN